MLTPADDLPARFPSRICRWIFGIAISLQFVADIACTAEVPANAGVVRITDQAPRPPAQIRKDAVLAAPARPATSKGSVSPPTSGARTAARRLPLDDEAAPSLPHAVAEPAQLRAPAQAAQAAPPPDELESTSGIVLTGHSIPKPPPGSYAPQFENVIGEVGIDPPPTGPLELPNGDDGFHPDEEDLGSYPPLIAPTPKPSAFDSALTEPEQPFTFREDIRNLFPMLRDDLVSIVTWKNAFILAAGAGGAVAMRYNLDSDVRDYTAEHPKRWGKGTDTLRCFGEADFQVPVIAGIYAYGLWSQDVKTHDFSKALISSYSIASISTVILKGITNTPRPDPDAYGGHYGFPSYHTASSFAIAATIEEYYGWWVGVPAYTIAGLVGWSRIDGREHELSDVFFGAVLGYVVGKSVAAAHKDRDGDAHFAPYYDPVRNAGGVMIQKAF